MLRKIGKSNTGKDDDDDNDDEEDGNDGERWLHTKAVQLKRL